MTSDIDEEQALFEEVRRRLQPAGWRVALGKASPTHFVITLEHDLTSKNDVFFDRRWADNSDYLNRVVGQSEFDVIAGRPAHVPHAALLRSIREAAMGWKWPPSVIPVIARTLQAKGVITEGEADWLEDAGASWTDTVEALSSAVASEASSTPTVEMNANYLSKADWFELIAEILNEWFPGAGWTAHLVMEVEDIIGRGAQEEFSNETAPYAEFGIVLLDRAGVIRRS